MQQSKNTFKPLAIRGIIADKNAKLAKRLPGFIVRYLHRIMHIDEMNQIMEEDGHLRGVDFVEAQVKRFNIKFNLQGIENIPLDRSLIFASNHPLGGFDGTLLMSIVKKTTHRDSWFLVNDFLMNVTPLKEWFIPINKVGGQARGALQKVEEAYLSDAHMLIFPAGICSRKIKGKITDLKWNKHFIQKAVQYQRDIVPVHFSGRNSSFFYNLARLRKWLGIKFNIEMMYLADETFKHKNKTFTITFGAPIPHESLTNKKSQTAWAAHVKDIVYSLPVCNKKTK